ncbi:prepilin-type N-terminal cleavage/methylation domain-containing protein [Bacillus sp. NP157]|nr:prepilin-type N-terminal cleavage/methylation domain-containing protein [Bacillus sp. NP157]
MRRPVNAARTPPRQAGVSLVELLLVLGVLTLLTIAAFIVYPYVRDGIRADHEATHLETITANFRSTYGLFGPNPYHGISTAAAIAMGVPPADMLDGRTSLTSPFGPVTIGGNYYLPGNTTFGFTVNYTNVPSRVCAHLATAVAPQFSPGYVMVSGTSVAINGLSDPSWIVQKCYEQNQVTMMFVGA